MNRRQLNFINFVRGVEPRLDIDLFAPVVSEMRLAKRYDFPATWLLQYDAFTKKEFSDFFHREMPESHELGIWFEVVQENVENAGIQWHGRYSWDWFCNAGFSIAYTVPQREKIIQCCMERFKDTFGYYPRILGSWLWDAHTLQYLTDHYQIDAFCCCRDQIGTDGYTLHGGYWANGYYPSKTNFYLPGSSKETQIPAPMFRMLGSDPIHQYEADPNGANGQTVHTLEPAWRKTTAEDCSWTRWFFHETYTHPCLAMSYVQTGQENSFGKDVIKPALTYQYQMVREMADAQKIDVVKLSDSGTWFRENFPETPASVVTAMTDVYQEGRQAVWYLTRFYRAYLQRDVDGLIYIRDIHFYDDAYQERYYTAVCRTTNAVFDALPAIDGVRWNDRIRIGNHAVQIIRTEENQSDDILYVFLSDGAVITFSPDGIRIKDSQFYFEPGEANVLRQEIESGVYYCSYEGFAYYFTITDTSIKRIDRR